MSRAASTKHQPSLRARMASTAAIRTDVNARFRMAKDALGLTGADIARGSGLTRAYISRIVNDQANIGLDLLIYLASEHGISIDWLLTGTGEMYRPDAPASEIATLRTEVKELRDIVTRYIAPKR
jgi:transcriptional regulator with XRE-family HTH domain